MSHPTVVSENPADITPHIVVEGSQKMYDFEQIGNTMYAGGNFDEVQDPFMTTTYARQNFFAFDRETGVVSPLDLSFDGIVTGIEASADETALFISGAFSDVNGITRRGLAKYDLVNEQIDPAFAPTGMRTVSDIKLVNGSLIAVGNFDKHVMALDPTTGDDLGTIDITVEGVVDPTDETRVRRFEVSPDGTKLVATGNFTTVNGQNRKRAFMLNLGSPATLSTWYAPRLDVDCAAPSRLVSAQGVDFSPDGSYFVMVSTGGPTGTQGICDATARFETANESSTVEPTWINWTGGDSLWSVAVTGPAVYVGGHQRWLDNPDGHDSAGPGAVSRPGIGAIDPVTGMALPWNPTKSRNDGARVLFAAPDGLWVGSDGARFGHEDHVGIGFAPFDLNPPDVTRPQTFIDSGPSGPVSGTSATFAFSASESAAFQCRLDVSAFAPCTSPVSYDNLITVSHTFQVVAVDDSYNMDLTPAEQSWNVVPPGSELIGNPGFEVDTSGWKGDSSSNSLARTAGGYLGGWAVEVSKTSSSGNCGLDESTTWVTSTDPGSYTASIWARSDTPGLTLKLRVREYANGSKQGTATETIALTSSWQQVSTNYAPVVPGSSLDFEAYTSNAPAGVCFHADDASIRFDVGTPPDKVAIMESGGSTDVSEDGLTDTYSVVLTTQPADDVLVTMTPDGQSVVSATAPGSETILSADFDADEDGFSYVDDSFRGTAEPAYAAGVHLPSGGFSGGGLRVTLGGLDSSAILGMSGGWQQSFTLNEPTDVTVSLRYNLTQAANYENDEFSQALVSIDGVLYGDGQNDYLAQLVGVGNGGSSQSTGWQTFELNTGTLSAGAHTLAIGAYNNKKTAADETTEVLIDDVLATAESTSAAALTFTPSNWNVAQTVTVTAVDDALAEGPHTSTITHAVSSQDPDFDGLPTANVVANITDNDTPPGTPGVTITQSGGTTDVTEGGAVDSYTVVLDSVPTANVDVTVTPDNQTDLGTGAGTAILLTFTPANALTPQPVNVTAVDDMVVEGPHTSTLTHAAASTDTDYNGIAINNVVANITDNDTTGDPILHFSLHKGATLPGGLTVANEDIVDFDGTDFSLFFDGSDVGLSGTNVDAFAVIAADQILISFRAPETVPGIAGTVEDSDIVKFTATQLGDTTSGTFELFLRGSDVGLSPGAEDIDAVDLHDDGRLIVSTVGSFDVVNVSGADEDLIAFTPDVPGDYSSGTWEMYFDGSDVELGREDVFAVALDANGDIHLSTTNAFAVTNVSGEDEDVFTFMPTQTGADTTGTYSATLLFDGSQFGLDANDVNAIDLPLVAAMSAPMMATQDTNGGGSGSASEAWMNIDRSSSLEGEAETSERSLDQVLQDYDSTRDGGAAAFDAQQVTNYLRSPQNTVTPRLVAMQSDLASALDDDLIHMLADDQLRVKPLRSNH